RGGARQPKRQPQARRPGIKNKQEKRGTQESPRPSLTNIYKWGGVNKGKAFPHPAREGTNATPYVNNRNMSNVKRMNIYGKYIYLF
ncbi:hypothetical protein, partial [Bacteroides heparinolyticus]|uniref:hypothetical protein n=1 Tax=Prevotella heparinolytica TaxID=28113 RepID=UPI00359F4555